MNRRYSIILVLIFCVTAGFSQGSGTFEKVFEKDYYGYKSKTAKSLVFPSIIKASVCDFNKWGFAEINVNTEKLEKNGFQNPLVKYTERKFRENLMASDFDHDYPHAWGVIDGSGKFVVEPRFGHLYNNPSIKNLKYLFVRNMVFPDYGKSYLVNRTNGTTTLLASGFFPDKAEWIDADYFYYDIRWVQYMAPGNIRARGVMRYDGTLVVDTLFKEIIAITTNSATLFLAEKNDGSKELFRTNDGNMPAENLSNSRFSDITYLTGTEFFQVIQNGETLYLSTTGELKSGDEVKGLIGQQQVADFTKRLSAGGLTDDEFRDYYENDLTGQLYTLPAGIRDGYGVVSVWSKGADVTFSINNGTFGTTGETRTVNKASFWAGCNSDLTKQISDLKAKTSTANIVVPFGNYQVTVTDMDFGSKTYNTYSRTYETNVYTTTKTYSVTIDAYTRCMQVQIE